MLLDHRGLNLVKVSQIYDLVLPSICICHVSTKQKIENTSEHPHYFSTNKLPTPTMGSTTKVGISPMRASGFPEWSTRVKPPMSAPSGRACIRLYQ
ncbi:Os01g0272650 [Oryza sativa Japonica Group]|uniref:Os01g0272650 protein n=1 Tax=Oryza sativa subsp. japonica TaxID=39947 RepID=A0A0P0V1F5_ORYSJ|nr:hypothetical protein EE612_001712 [Oryza sativa]BAS71512.1 Os01g0272650 [Oryza sativa Japonica Group]